MKKIKFISIVLVFMLLVTSCGRLEQITKKLSGGLSEIIAEAVDGVVQATIKIIFLGVFSTQQDGTQLIAFEGETPSGKVFKGVALGATQNLASSNVNIKGKAFTVQGKPVLLANGITTEGKIPLVMIAVETDTIITNPGIGETLKVAGTLDLSAQTINKGENSPTVFRYIAETENKLTLLGIGISKMRVPTGVQDEVLEWQSDGDVRLEGNIIKTDIGATLKATTDIRTEVQGNTQILEAFTYSVVVQTDQ